MKLNKLAALVAAACTLGASTAFAHAPNISPDLEIWMSGATAQDSALEKLFSDLCTAGTMDTYYDNDNPSSKGSHHRAIFCTIPSANITGGLTTAGGNPKVLFHKYSVGGSGNGVQPVADSVALPHLLITNSNCTKTAPETFYRCTTAGFTAPHVSDGGISDVEPALFVGPNVPSGFAPVTAAQLNKLEVKSQNAVVFGIPVSLKLRNALQLAQGLTVGSDNEANMPSLTRTQITSLFAGGVWYWDDVTTASGSPLTDVTNGKTYDAVPDGSGLATVKICRRVTGSGTQAQFNALFMKDPCMPGAVPSLTATPVAGAPIVVLNSGSGDVETCLDAADAAGQWAVGVQSTEKNMNLAHNYRFIKIDGVAPTLKNAVENKYWDWVEQSIQWRKAQPAGDVLNVLKTIASDAGKPSIINALNTSYVHPFGQAGYLALNTNGWTPSATGLYDPATPVLGSSKSTTGSVNNCRAPIINVYPTSLGF